MSTMSEDVDVIGGPISCGCGVAILVIFGAAGASIALAGVGVAWRILSWTYSWAF
jgi:hypothetical protein